MERLSHVVLALAAAVPAAATGASASALPQTTTVLQGPTKNAVTAAAPARFALSEHPVLYAEGTLGPVELDRAVGGAAPGDGAPLTVDGRVFARGFGARATSAIAVSLGGRAILFHAWVGIDDTADPTDRARFRVVADGALLFDSGTRSGGQPALSTGVLDVRGVEELVLLALDDDDGFSSDFVDWCEPTVFAAGPPAADDTAVRALRGRFSASEPWPVEAIHAALVPDGRIVSHASASPTDAGDPSPAAPHASTVCDLYDPVLGTRVSVDHPTAELVGASATHLPSGALLSAGGFRGRVLGEALGSGQTSTLDLVTPAWLPGVPMAAARYGAGVISLGSGAALALGGQDEPGAPTAPEFCGPLGQGTLDGIDTSTFDTVGDPAIDRTFPWLHLMPDGRVLRAGWDERYALLDTTGTGEISLSATRESVQRAFGTSTQIRGDRVLVVGGTDHRGIATREAQRSAIELRLTGTVPQIIGANPMTFRRADHDATILADGRMLVTGGAAVHAGASSGSAIQVAELFDPGTGEWTLAARSSRPRGYRSTALLVPDGRVWLGGGDPAGPTAEFYEPPYLFDASGALASRPSILDVPRRVAYGETFQALWTGPNAIARASFVRLGAATHGTNSDQRFLELGFSDVGSGVLEVDAPLRGNDAPPGDYMLFLIDGSGVPSVASIVSIGPPRPTAWTALAALAGPSISARHEAGAAEVNGKIYLMGGRGSRPTQEYDPASRAWRSLAPTPIELHHFQPVVLDGLVYVVGAFTGPFPNESNVQNIRIYDPRSDSWSVGASLPAGRQRGSAGAVVYDGRIWLVGGNNQGHNGGARSWFDVYDPASDSWTALPDAPRARDHFLAGVVGHRLVVAGGRRTTQPNPFVGTVPEVDVYDFATGTWSTLGADLPTERAGTMTVTQGRHVVVIGGESASQVVAHDEVEALDVLSEQWITLPPLDTGRHSGGAVTFDGRAYAISGSGNRGGTPELTTAEIIGLRETLFAVGTNPVRNAGFDLGLAAWTTVGDVTLVEEHGVAPPGARVRGGSAASVALVQAGAPYRARALYTADAASGSAILRLEFLNGSGGVLGLNSAPLATTGSTPQFGDVTATAPPGSATARITLIATGSKTLVFDDLTLTQL
ncbi:MAG: NPCBM/NEW2 domain-containing protein [Planctomycetota bacterium]